MADHMDTIFVTVKVKSVPFRGNQAAAKKYIREAVRGWVGGMDPDDYVAENYDWRSATILYAGKLKSPQLLLKVRR